MKEMNPDHKAFFEKVAALCYEYGATIDEDESLTVRFSEDGKNFYRNVSFDAGVAMRATRVERRTAWIDCDVQFTGADKDPCFHCGAPQIAKDCECENTDRKVADSLRDIAGKIHAGLKSE